MTRQLSTLIDADLPLLRSIRVLIAQLKPSNCATSCRKSATRSVGFDVLKGSRNIREFDRLYVNMVRAGEVGGMLEVVLQRLATFMERRQALKRRA